jgi:hypothetical protein
MLAQNFKSSADLGITDPELDALIKVLGMLERGDLAFQRVKPLKNFKPKNDHCFNMGPYLVEAECGTTGCIAGWAYLVSGGQTFKFASNRRGDVVSAHRTLPSDLFDLFHCGEVSMEKRYKITPSQAGAAVRSYLSTGKANWAEQLALASTERTNP